MEISNNVLEAVKNAATENKLTCAQAWKIIEELKVPPKMVGEAANQLEIKIRNCELGCF